MRSFLEGLVYVLGLIFCFAIATFTPGGSSSNSLNNNNDSTSLVAEKPFSYWSQTWPPLASSFLIFLTMYVVIMIPLLAYESVPWIMLFLGSLVVCIGAICIYIVSAYVTEVGIGICHGAQSTIVILLFASAINKLFNNSYNDKSDIDDYSRNNHNHGNGNWTESILEEGRIMKICNLFFLFTTLIFTAFTFYRYEKSIILLSSSLSGLLLMFFCEQRIPEMLAINIPLMALNKQQETKVNNVMVLSFDESCKAIGFWVAFTILLICLQVFLVPFLVKKIHSSGNLSNSSTGRSSSHSHVNFHRNNDYTLSSVLIPLTNRKVSDGERTQIIINPSLFGLPTSGEGKKEIDASININGLGNDVSDQTTSLLQHSSKQLGTPMYGSIGYSDNNMLHTSEQDVINGGQGKIISPGTVGTTATLPSGSISNVNNSKSTDVNPEDKYENNLKPEFNTRMLSRSSESMDFTNTSNVLKANGVPFIGQNLIFESYQQIITTASLELGQFFGFQSSNMGNQREHCIYLLANHQRYAKKYSMHNNRQDSPHKSNSDLSKTSNAKHNFFDSEDPNFSRIEMVGTQNGNSDKNTFSNPSSVEKSGEAEEEEALFSTPVHSLHYRLFANYRAWCTFLSIRPSKYETFSSTVEGQSIQKSVSLSYSRSFQENIELSGRKDESSLDLTDVDLPSNDDLEEARVFLYEIMLWLLVWGEAANLRHMPECICWLYHKLLADFVTTLENPVIEQEGAPCRDPGTFLSETVTPIYKVVQSSMSQTRNDHVARKNYDDFNEFFWAPKCLKFDYISNEVRLSSTPDMNLVSDIDDHNKIQIKVSQYASLNDGDNPSNMEVYPIWTKSDGLGSTKKTYLEKRSWLAIIYSFKRVIEWHLLSFQLLSIYAFASILFWDLAYTLQLLSSIFITMNICGIVWILLEIYMIYPSIKPEPLIIAAITVRTGLRYILLVYQCINLGLSFQDDGLDLPPGHSFQEKMSQLHSWWDYLWVSAFLVLTYFFESIFEVFIPSLSATLLNRNSTRNLTFETFLNFFLFNSRNYTGKNVWVPLREAFIYQFSWLLILTWKLYFSYHFEIKFNALPSVELYDDYINYPDGSIFATTILICVRWIPFIFIYCLDTMIWYSIYAGITGIIVGYNEHLGMVKDFQDIKKNFMKLPYNVCSNLFVDGEEIGVTLHDDTTTSAKNDSLKSSKSVRSEDNFIMKDTGKQPYVDEYIKSASRITHSPFDHTGTTSTPSDMGYIRNPSSSNSSGKYRKKSEVPELSMPRYSSNNLLGLTERPASSDDLLRLNTHIKNEVQHINSYEYERGQTNRGESNQSTEEMNSLNSFNTDNVRVQVASYLDVSTEKWLTFSAIWNDIVGHLRETDLISNYEKSTLLFHNLQGFQKPIYLPIFQTAGLIESVVATSRIYSKQFEYELDLKFNSEGAKKGKQIINSIPTKATNLFINSVNANTCLKEAIQEVWELGFWMLLHLFGPRHSAKMQSAQDAINLWFTEDLFFFFLNFDRMDSVVKAMTNVVGCLKGIEKRKVKPRVENLIKRNVQNTLNETVDKQRRFRVSGGRESLSNMKKSFSSGGLHLLPTSQSSSNLLKSPLNGSIRNTVLTPDDDDPLRDKVRDSVRGLLGAIRSILKTDLKIGNRFTDPNSDSCIPQYATISSFSSSIADDMKGFMWDDIYTSICLDNLSKHSQVKAVIQKLEGLLKVQVVDAQPKSIEAQRRLSFFVNSLFMQMPSAPPMEEMLSWTVLTPYYSEDVMYSRKDLESTNQNGVTTLLYLQTLYNSDWNNFMERLNITDKSLIWSRKYEAETRLWASLRAQTLARTVEGIMYYERALRKLGELEGKDKTTISSIIREKFGYVVSCQVYGRMKKNQDPKAKDIDALLHRFPNLRVAYIDEVRKQRSKGAVTYYSVLVKSVPYTSSSSDPNSNNEIYHRSVPEDFQVLDDNSYTSTWKERRIQEVYRIKLPGNPIIGEGKPENQNHAVIFTRGEHIQAIDMNQDGYYEEGFKMRNLLEEFKVSYLQSMKENNWQSSSDRARKEHWHTQPKLKNGYQNIDDEVHLLMKKKQSNRNLEEKKLTRMPMTILGFREHIFTGSVSSLANYMACQEFSFVTLGQRVLNNPMQMRLHYGHPDIFDKLFSMQHGGISKASKGINLSEDIFAGYSQVVRGGKVDMKEYVQVGKGRDVGMQQIYKFEAKLSQGAAEQSISRDVSRMVSRIDFCRLLTFYFGGIGTYISAVLTIEAIYLMIYLMLGLALFNCEKIGDRPLVPQGPLQIMLAGLGVLQTIPLFATLLVEKGGLESLKIIFQIFISGGPLYFIFHIQTKAYYYFQTILAGNASYKATGRGFVTGHSAFDENYRFFANSHFYLGFEMLISLILLRIFSASEQYASLTWSLWLAVSSFLFAPFWFNPLTFSWKMVCKDYQEWLRWMSTKGGNEQNSWETWFRGENDYVIRLNLSARLILCQKAVFYFVVAYGLIWASLKEDGYDRILFLLEHILLIIFFRICLWATDLLTCRAFCMWVFDYSYEFTVRGIIKLGLWVLIILQVVLLGVADVKNLLYLLSSYYFIAALNVCCMALLGLNSLNIETYKLHDYVVGHILFIPLFLLSALQIPNMIQTWLLYHNALSSDLRVEELLSLQSVEREERQNRNTLPEDSIIPGTSKTEPSSTAIDSSGKHISTLPVSINNTKVVKHFSSGDVIIEGQDLGHSVGFLPVESKEIRIQDMMNSDVGNGNGNGSFRGALGMNKVQFRATSKSRFQSSLIDEHRDIIKEDSVLERSNTSLSGADSMSNSPTLLQATNIGDFKFISPSNPPPK